MTTSSPSRSEAQPQDAAPDPATAPRWRAALHSSLTTNGLLLVLILWVVFLTVATDGFFTRANILLVLRQSSTIGVVAIGATMVILLGEIDLSLGAIVSVCGVVLAKLLIAAGLPVAMAGIAGVLLGAACGLVNGLLVTVLRINSFMATLGTMSVLGGLAFLITNGLTLFGDQLNPLAFVANGYIAGLPFPVILLFVFYAVAWFLLRRRTSRGPATR